MIVICLIVTAFILYTRFYLYKLNKNFEK